MFHLVDAGELAQFFDASDHLFDFFVGEEEGFNHAGFRDLFGAAFHHGDGIGGTGDDEVEDGLFALGNGWIDDEGIIDQADAYGTDGAIPRNLGDVQGRGNAVHRQHIGFVFLVKGDDEARAVGIAHVAFWEERAQWAVGQAAGERFVVGGAGFTLKEVTWDAASGVSLFAVIHHEGEKALAGLGIAVAHRGEHHGVTNAHNH